jgi:hypothetical protein
MAANADLKANHKEAVRLSRAYWHLPLGLVLLVSLLLTSVASAGSMIWSLGLVNPRSPRRQHFGHVGNPVPGHLCPETNALAVPSLRTLKGYAS